MSWKMSGHASASKNGVMEGSTRAATALTAKACLIFLKVTWGEQLLYQNNDNYHY